MSTLIAVSLILTASIILIAAARYRRKCLRRMRHIANVPGADVLILSLITSGKRMGKPLLITISWIILSLSNNVIVPILLGHARFLFGKFHFVTITNYCIFVPMLVGSYAFLIKSLGRLQTASTWKSD